MSELLFSSLNIIQLLLIITFAIGMVYLEKKLSLHKLLLLILGSSILSELFSVLFIVNKIDYGLLFTVSTLVHNLLWLVILGYVIKNIKVIKYLIIINLGFAFFNLFILEGTGHFNNYTFVLSAFLYLTIFIITSFKELKNENFIFFYSNDYLLIVSPVSFLLGLSFYFGFKDADLGDIIIIGKLNLYDIIIDFVSVVYYSLIIIFIIREKKLRNAK